MTDREMLELAAKAAVITGYRYSESFQSMAHWNESDGGWFDACCLWNPLEDDGDALRLAAKLSMRIDTCVKTGCAARWGIDCENVIYVGISSDNDLLKATRMAIVLAAAQIGAQM